MGAILPSFLVAPEVMLKSCEKQRLFQARPKLTDSRSHYASRLAVYRVLATPPLLRTCFSSNVTPSCALRWVLLFSVNRFWDLCYI